MAEIFEPSEAYDRGRKLAEDATPETISIGGVKETIFVIEDDNLTDGDEALLGDPKFAQGVADGLASREENREGHDV